MTISTSSTMSPPSSSSSSFLLPLLLIAMTMFNTASAYVFEFSFTVEGPPNACDNRDVRKILHGMESLLDERGNQFLREHGYTGFVDRLELFLNEKPPTKEDLVSTYGPYWGEGRCTSCPKADEDSFYFTKRRGLAGSMSMSKKRLTEAMNQALREQLPDIVMDRGSPGCAASSGQWRADFQWM